MRHLDCRTIPSVCVGGGGMGGVFNVSTGVVAESRVGKGLGFRLGLGFR